MKDFRRRIGLIVLLGLIISACTSTPPRVAQNSTPAPKHIPLSHKIMGREDSRLPNYGKTIQAQMERRKEFYDSRMGILYFNNGYTNMTIDGKPWYLSNATLPPGKHRVSFTYKRTVTVFPPGYAPEARILNVPITATGNMEIDVKVGKVHRITAHVRERINDVNSDTNTHTVTHSVEFDVIERDYEIERPEYGNTYLEPYDETVPAESHAFFVFQGNHVYIVGFDGQSVSWGRGLNYSDKKPLAIGIPEGEHTIEVVSLIDSSHYTGTITCAGGSSYLVDIPRMGTLNIYELELDEKGNIPYIGYLTSIGQLTKESEPFNFNVAASPSTAQAELNGPEITIAYDYRDNLDRSAVHYLSHIYISPAAENSWGANRLRPGQRVNDRGGSIALRLPYPIDQVDRYDILLIDNRGDFLTAFNVALTPDRKIVWDNHHRSVY